MNNKSNRKVNNYTDKGYIFSNTPHSLSSNSMQESCIMRVRYAKARKNKRWNHHKQILMVSQVQCTITRSVGSLADLTQES